ncbi:hypothetical protein IFM89_005297 [Coptis chinensis]|uniref:F-box domain-containing protein n=1 Tax=Coptis chinensis TaxID=261450 RepID=A0A835ITY2_9MAGN|nr:hypothetical protein IFM89_005297 [Coptis chinensis]
MEASSSLTTDLQSFHLEMSAGTQCSASEGELFLTWLGFIFAMFGYFLRVMLVCVFVDWRSKYNPVAFSCRKYHSSKKKHMGEPGLNAMEVFHNDDLVGEIMLHLPPIYVLRFKMVCKKWHRIITNPSFRRRHTLYFHRYSLSRFLPSILLQDHKAANSLKAGEPLSLLLNRDDRWRAPSLIPNPAFDFVPVFEPKYRRGFVCNPLTKEYIKLPSYVPTKGSEVVKNFGMNLVFDPSKSLHYKVVAVYEIEVTTSEGFEYSSSHIVVYSSESHSWGISRRYYRVPNVSTISAGILVNDSLFWPPDGDGEYLHYYNVQLEVLVSWKLPPKSPVCKYRSWHYLGGLVDKVYLIEQICTYESWHGYRYIRYIGYEVRIDLSMMAESFSFVIEPSRYKDATEQIMFPWFRAICIHRLGEQVFLFIGIDCMIYSINISQPQCVIKKVGLVSHLVQYSDGSRMFSREWDVIPYSNSLFPLQ